MPAQRLATPVSRGIAENIQQAIRMSLQDCGMVAGGRVWLPAHSTMHVWSDGVELTFHSRRRNVALTSEARMRCHMSGMAASVWNVIPTLFAELSCKTSP